MALSAERESLHSHCLKNREIQNTCSAWPVKREPHFKTTRTTNTMPSILATLLLTMLHASRHRSILDVALEECAARSRERLLAGSRGAPFPGVVNFPTVFADVSISVPLRRPLVKRDVQIRPRDGDKNLLEPAFAFHGEHCVVYGIGIAGDASWERNMAQQYGCEVHAFDCTVSPAAAHVNGQPFTFHNWCIGTLPATGSATIATRAAYAHTTHEYTVRPLANVLRQLNHTQPLSLLKFDIEGFEWDLIEKELLQLPKALLPRELSFELHTQGANPKYVPPQLVREKSRSDVASLFLHLFDIGYRVISVEVNAGDHRCAEFGLIYAPLKGRKSEVHNSYGSAQRPSASKLPAVSQVDGLHYC